jgi:hypothetical protein
VPREGGTNLSRIHIQTHYSKNESCILRINLETNKGKIPHQAHKYQNKVTTSLVRNNRN